MTMKEEMFNYYYEQLIRKLTWFANTQTTFRVSIWVKMSNHIESILHRVYPLKGKLDISQIKKITELMYVHYCAIMLSSNKWATETEELDNQVNEILDKI